MLLTELLQSATMNDDVTIMNLSRTEVLNLPYFIDENGIAIAGSQKSSIFYGTNPNTQNLTRHGKNKHQVTCFMIVSET